MTIPLWLPWALLVALVAVALPRRESWLRTWGPAAVALVVAGWLTADHYWVTQTELADATTDAAAVVDGSMGGVTQDRLRIEIADRLGRAVRVENAPTATGADVGTDEAEISYGFSVGTSADLEDGPAMCVNVVESRVDTTVRAITLASVTTESGACM